MIKVKRNSTEYFVIFILPLWLLLFCYAIAEPLAENKNIIESLTDNAGELELDPDIEKYFSLAINIELKNYRVRREIQKKVIQPLKKIAAEYVKYEEYKTAEEIYLRLIDITQRVYGEGNRHTEYFMSKLAWLYLQSRNFARRALVLEAILNLKKQRVGDSHMSLVKDIKQLAYTYRQMGDYSKSVTTYKDILKIYADNEYNEKDNFRLFSSILYDLASVYIELGDYAQAEPYFRRSLPPLGGSFKNINQLNMVRLNSYLFALQFTGKYKEAETLYLKMLKNLKATSRGESMLSAIPLLGLGGMYHQLGAYSKALKAKKQALSLLTKMAGATSAATAFAMNSLAETYIATGQYKKAQKLLKDSFLLLNTFQMNIPVELRVDKNLAKINLGLTYLELKQFKKAEQIYRQVLADNIKKYPAYHPIIGYTKIRLAEVLLKQGKYQLAASNAFDALTIANTKSSPYMLIRSYSLLAKIRYAQKRVAEAVFFGKQAVNTMQSVRGALVNTDKSLQKAFVASQQENYEVLAGWLIDAGRLAEAEQVLAMLKEDEYFNFIRRASSGDPRRTYSQLSMLEQTQFNKLKLISKHKIEVDKQLTEIKRVPAGFRTEQQKKQLILLKAQVKQVQAEFKKVLHDINVAFSNNSKQAGQSFIPATVIKKSFFKNAGKNIAIIYFIQLDNSLRIIVRTSKGEFSEKVAVTRRELRQAVWKLKTQISRPDKDYHAVSKKIYQWLISPVEQSLKQQAINTLLLYKKGSLRYIPLSVLYDGKQFLVEKYAISQYSASLRAVKNTKSAWTIAGLGVSKQLGKFAPLPMVPFELDNIIKQNPQDISGVFNGKIYVNEKFTKNRFKSLLAENFNTEHIATHYEFKPGTEEDSFLLLGDGKRLDLASIRSANYDFSNIELLTLSACETALNDRYADGREIEGLATLVQRQGAKAVLASLWKVADCSTGTLMQKFYAYRNKGMTKAAALRKSQLDFIRGKVAAQKVSANLSKGCEIISGLKNPAATYQHPYFWAAFILMGNWQ